jgi:hypothetical protein
MRDLGIEFISVFGLRPVDFVHLAADLGCRYISTALTGRPLKSLGYLAFSLKKTSRSGGKCLPRWMSAASVSPWPRA